MQLTPQQRKKLERIQEVLKMGDLAIAKMILELEDKLDAEIPQIKNIIERLKGDKGDNYVLTSKDKKEIAKFSRELLQDDKLISEIYKKIDLKAIKEAVLKDIPKPKPAVVDYSKIKVPKVDTEKIALKASKLAIDEIKPLIPDKESIVNNIPIVGEKIRDSLELIKDENEKLRMEAIRRLPETLKELEGKIGKSGNARGGGIAGINRIAEDGAIKWTGTGIINFTNGFNVTPTTSGVDVVVAGTTVNVGNLGTAKEFDWSEGTHFIGVLGNDVTITHANEVDGQKITLALSYDDTAQRTITWSDIDKWDGGSEPTTPSSSGEVLIVSIARIGATVYASANIFS